MYSQNAMAVNGKLAMTLFVSLATFGCLILSAECYSDGAPPEVCGDMLPKHGPLGQTTPSPYTLTLNRKSVKPGETITLTLASKDSGKFKGFLVQARDAAGSPIGSFAPLPASKTSNEFKGKWKLLSCPKGPANVSVYILLCYICRYSTLYGDTLRP